MVCLGLEPTRTNPLSYGGAPSLHPAALFNKICHSQPLFFNIFVFSIQLIVNILYTFCQWLDSNRWPLGTDGTTLPTEPQPLPC